MSNLKDLVLKNRSYRGYDSSVRQTNGELMELVDYARLMPAARNAQPLKYFLAIHANEILLLIHCLEWLMQPMRLTGVSKILL